MASQEYEDAIDHKDDAVSCLKNAQRNLSSIVSKSNVFFEEFSDDSQYDVITSMQNIQEIIKRLSK